MSTFPRGVWVAYAAIGGLLGLQAILPREDGPALPPPAGSASTIAVDFAASGSIELLHVKSHEAYAMVLVKNDSSIEIEVEVHAIALDRDGNELSGSSRKDLNALSPSPVKVRLVAPSTPFNQWLDNRLPARGFVVLRAWPKINQNVQPTVRVREIVVPQVQPSYAEFRVTIVAILAALAVLVVGLAKAPRAQPNAAIKGTPKWTSQSWSTNLAIGGALLTQILSISALPAHGYYANKASYAALSAFFAALVALAPAVYGLTRVGSVSEPMALGLFSFASAVTVWATTGQLGTAAVIMLELGRARVMSQSTAIAAAVLFCGVAVLVLSYALRALDVYSKTGGNPAPVSGDAAAVAGAGPVPPPAAINEWPLL